MHIVMTLSHRISVVALILALSPTLGTLLAQNNEPYDVVLIKEIDRGPGDAIFVGRLEDKIEQWVGTVGRVLVHYKQELPSSRQERMNYLKGNAMLSIYARIIKDGNSAAVIFRIEKTDASANSHTPVLKKFNYSKALDPTLTMAEKTLEKILKTVVIPMLIIYKDAGRGTRILADCIRSMKTDDNFTKRASKILTRIYPDQMRKLSGLTEIGIHGLNNDQVRYICLHYDDDEAPKLLSENLSVRLFFDRVIYGDLESGAGQIHLTVENREATDDHRTIELPQVELDSKAKELAKQILELISIP